MTDIRWLIEIVEKGTGVVVKTMGPETQHTANRVKRGVEINLDWMGDQMKRVNVRAILADEHSRRELLIRSIVFLQAVEGIETTRDQAAFAYDKARMAGPR